MKIQSEERIIYKSYKLYRQVCNILDKDTSKDNLTFLQNVVKIIKYK